MIEIKFLEHENRAVAYDGNIEIGQCNYIEKNDIWNIVHTEVDNKYQGQGIARKLVEVVISKSKENNKKIIAECSYAKKILDTLI